MDNIIYSWVFLSALPFLIGSWKYLRDTRLRSAHYEDAAYTAYLIARHMNVLSVFPNKVLTIPQDSRSAWKNGTPAFIISLYKGNKDRLGIPIGADLMEVAIYIARDGNYAELWVGRKKVEKLFLLRRDLEVIESMISDKLKFFSPSHEAPRECAPRIFSVSYAN